MRPFKSSENNQTIEGGLDRSVSNKQFSEMILLHEMAINAKDRYCYCNNVYTSPNINVLRCILSSRNVQISSFLP